MTERTLPDNKRRQREIYDRYFLEYEHATARVHEMLRPFTIARWLAACEGKSILDVGCGNAYVLAELLRAGTAFAGYTGVDLSDEMIERDRRRYADVPAVEFMMDDAETLARVAGRRFDVVISFGCLHHLDRPEAAVTRIGEVLTGTGVLLAVELNRAHPAASFVGLYAALLGVNHESLRRALARARSGVRRTQRTARAGGDYVRAHPGHPGRRTPAEYRAMLRAAGFRHAEVRCLYLDLLPYPVYRASLPLFRVMVAASRPLLSLPRLRDAGSVVVMRAER